ncbi:hypothetical protein [Arthrobacter sp. A2-55]|uniref:hypothetical protein n=1 Tax=Arthrobacter sp. A2-55 TaxID=2897337 RepID=UPI0021CDAFFC|nr:hypothetical protein [Arthrobacter sp. A2-55]MCU6480160.1 hypothetical protein [Arthrobacter sp. A2-55]
MIPAPPPVVPILILISLTVLMLLFTAVKSGSGAMRGRGELRTRRWGMIAAGASAALAACGMMLGGTVITTHQAAYDRAVWAALADSYGVVPVSPGLGFRPGVSFDAKLAGRTASCLVEPPSVVLCDDVRVKPLGATAVEEVTPPLDSLSHLSYNS